MKTSYKDHEFKNYYLDQLDEQLDNYPTVLKPKDGWINAIRKSLGMTIRQLAERLNVSNPTVVQYEQHEQKSSVTLNTLIRCADAMDCDFVYYFKPRHSLQEYRTKQAKNFVNKVHDQLEIYMGLEDQSVSEEQNKKERELETKRLIETWDKRIWNL